MTSFVTMYTGFSFSDLKRALSGSDAYLMDQIFLICPFVALRNGTPYTSEVRKPSNQCSHTNRDPYATNPEHGDNEYSRVAQDFLASVAPKLK